MTGAGWLALAQQGARDAMQSAPPGNAGYGMQLVQSLGALVVVCLLAWGVLRWAAKRGFGQFAAGRNLKVLERVALDARRSVYLVEAGSRVFLLGGGEGVQLLAELRPEELRQGAAASTGGRDRSAVVQLIERVLAGGKPAAETSTEPPPPES